MGVMDRYNESKKKKKDSHVNAATGGVMSRYENNTQITPASSVNENFINTFFTDANNFLGSAEEEFGKISWGNASSSYDARNRTWAGLSSRATSIQGWLDQNKDRLDEETYSKFSSTLDEINKGATSVLDSFKSASDYYSQFESEAQYKDAVKLNELYSMSSDEILPYINRGEEIAYTTSGGQNVSWQRLYDEKKKKEEAESLHSSLSSSDDWEHYIQQGKKTGSSSEYKYAGWDSEANSLTFFSDVYKDYLITARENPQFAQDTYVKYETAPPLDIIYAGVMNDEEYNIYSYYYGKYGEEKAKEYLKSISNELVDRYEEESLKAVAEMASEYPVLSSVLSVPVSILSGAEYIVDAVKYAATGELDTNIAAQYSSTIRGTVSENTDWMIGNWDAFDFLYNTGMSAADSITSMALLGNAGGVALGLSAAAQGTNDALARGADNKHAFWNGFASGVFEGLFETVSIGSFNALKEGATTTFKQFAKNIGKSMLVNASEETLTEIANIAYDWVANGDFSQWETSIRQYMQSGMSESEAKKKVALELGAQIAESGASGALMGFGFGAAGSGMNYLSGSRAAKDAYGSGRSLVEESLERASEGSEARVFAEAYKAALDGGKNLSGGDLYRLSEAYETDIINRDTAKIKAAAAERLAYIGEEGDIDQLSSIIAKQVKGEKLTADEKSILRSSYAGERVANELNPENIASGAYTSEWTEKIGTERINAGAYNKGLYDLAMEQTGAAVGEETVSATEDSTPTKEIVPEAKNTVSDDGKTVLIDTNEEVEIQGIASIENGKVKLRTNKGEVDAENISFGTETEALLYEAVTDMSAEAARNLVEAYDPSAGISASEYIHGFKDSYRYGFKGFAESELAKGVFTKGLSEAQRHRAYVVGKNAGVAAVREDQNARTEAKKRGENAAPKKGKVFINGKEYKVGEKTGLSGIRDTSVKGTVVLAERLGTNVYFYESYVDKNGKRVYRDENGNVEHAPHGKYDPKTGYIYIDLNAGAKGEGLILYTVAHELTHFIRDWSPAKFKVFADFLLENYAKKGVSVEALVHGQIQKAAKNGREISFDEAYEEVIADSCQAMLEDGSAIKKIAELKQKDATLWQKIKDFISGIVAKIKKAYAGLDPYSAEGRFVKNQLDTFEQLQSMWVDALVDAGETYSAVRDALGEDSTIKVNEDGEFLMGKTEDGKVLLNDRTWDEGGREILRATLALEGYSDEDINAALTIMDGKHKLVEQLNKEFIEQDNISKATLTTDLKTGKAVLSALVSNGDYPVNIDLLMVCKKRQAYQRVINRLCETGLIKQATLDSLAIAEINKILGKYGFETACLGCFVESRRIRIQEWAETICSEWNGIVDKMVGKGKAKSFDFASETFVKDLSDEEIVDLTSDLEAAYERDGLHYGRMKVVKKMEQLLREVPSLRKHLSVADLITPQGRTHLKQLSSELNSLVACRYGSNTPKIVQDFNPYNHELAQYGTVPTKYKSLREYLYAIGGARMQSFSDFIVENWFDYCQIVADLAARKLPMHTYTKEIVLAKLFGMTGIKINMSLIPDIDKSLGKEYAGLTRNAKGELELIWGDKDRYKATGGKSYMQSINFADAIALQNDPRYSANVGTIAVGVSDLHIRMMLDDPRIRMIIPYHSSGMNPIFAHLVGTEYYNDYTDVQNTTVKQLYDSNGNAVSLKLEKSQKDNLASGFEFNAVLQELGDARAAAKAYLEWCADASKHSITINGETYTAVLKPKFEQFSGHENYYKVLEDFNTYDSITEEAAPQGDVQQTYPEDFDDILRDELTVRENYRQKQEPKWDAAMSEIEGYLKKHTKAETKAYAKEHGIKLSKKDMKLSDRDSDHSESALSEFGTTTDFAQAGFVLKNGKLLKLSQYGLKGVQHKRIESVFSELKGDDAVVRFLQEGNVRIKADAYGIEIGADKAPSVSQLNTLSRFISSCLRGKGIFYLDITDANGRDVASVAYYSRNSTEEVIYDIKDYYERGGIPKGGDVLYSDRDSDYLDAVNRGDMETAQRMVDEAAKKAGYTQKAFHGTRSSNFYVFDKNRIGDNYGGYNAEGGAFDFTYDESRAWLWAGKAKGFGKPRVISAYIKAEKPFYAYNGEVAKELFELLPSDISDEEKQYAMANGVSFKEVLENHGIDFKKAVMSKGIDSYKLYRGDFGNIGVYSPFQIKSTDPVTYDDNGNVIPLSKRFDSKNSDIRYSDRATAEFSDADIKYSIREEAPPKKTVEVYKLMRLKDGQIYPLFIDSTEPLEVGTWYDADSPNLDFLKRLPSGIFLVDADSESYTTFDDYLAKSGEKKTKLPSKQAIEKAAADGLRWVYIEDTEKGQKRFGGETRKYWNLGINGSGAVSTFSMRPGYHAGSLPSMRQIGKGANKDLRDDSFVWTVGEVPADINYQSEADSNPDKDIPTHIPVNGYYLKATNADKAKSQADVIGWYVAGSYKINRIISDSEARRVIDEWNAKHPNATAQYDYDRESGMDFDADQMKLVPRSDIKYSDRDSYAPVFYSHMGKTIDEIKIAKMGAGGVVPYLKGRGVKDEEIKWSGIEAFLEGKKSVTKEELQEFVAGSQLQIVEQMSGEDLDLRYDGSKRQYTLHDSNGEVVDTFTYNEFLGGYVAESDEEIYSNDIELRESLLEAYGKGSAPKWADYRLDGGSNYRELVFQMPNNSYSNHAMRVHWGEDAEGVLAHARIQDFDTADGKMLFIEEIQSDYHNEGAEEGYFDSQEDAKLAALEAKVNDLFLEVEDYSVEMTGMAGEWEYIEKTSKGVKLLREYRAAKAAYDNAMNAAVKKIPDAPFRDTYHEYVLKRLIRMAAEEGYDIIGWTPAEIQDQRWDDHQYHEEGKGKSGNLIGYTIEYDQDMPKFLRKYGKKWGTTVGKTTLELGEYTDEDFERDFRSTWENRWSDYDDVEFDSYYDDDGRFTVRATNSETGEVATSTKGDRTASNEVWSMPITDSMKQSVLHEGQPMYSDRSDSDISNRELLANAMEAAAQNDIERRKLALYKEKIALINAEEKHLHELKERIGELSFAKGKKDVEQIKRLQFEAKQAENRINTYDRQLLALEASAPLKALLEREKKMAYKKAEQKGKDALAAYRERAARTQRELLRKARESRQKGIDGRRRTEMRHRIKKVVTDLDHLLRHGTKERNVKLGLQAAVASALEAVNMDTIAADERIAKLEQELMKAKTPEKVQEISRKIDHIREQGDRMEAKLESLRRAYVDIKNSEQGVPDYYKQEATLIAERVDSVLKKVGNTPLRNMSLSQLEEVHNLYQMVLTTVRNVNSLFVQGKLDDLHKNASAIMQEEEAIKPLKEERLALGDWWRKQAWNELIPVYAFEKIGSKTLTKFFWETIKGQNTFATDISEAKAFSEAAREKFGYGKWDLNKIHEFKLEDGRTFRVSLRQMMSIYAYSKREQALEHMRVGGFFFNDKATFRKEKGILKIVKSNESGYTISEDAFQAIRAAMTQEQIQYVDEMQDYLTKMGGKGNEVSRVLWGIDIFKEKVYFPLKSSRDFIYQANQPAQESSLKNDGMTKETIPHASNPIVLEDFDDVWASHVERMSKYHAFVLPIENLNKLMNYGTWVGTDSVAVSTMIRARHSDAANEYITQFIRDLNGASSMDGVSNPVFSFFNKFKKTAVAASLSVVVQQPTAILRASAVIDPKYFVGKPSLNLNEKWEELQKYAPIAIIKDIGGFDAGGGRQITEWLNADTKRGLDKVMGKVDDITMLGAALGDKVGWTAIWEAVKRETLHNNPKLSPKSEEFLKIAGDRFTEVIVLTQVYDSTLSRSGFMRSKHESVKMMTSFMGEPTVSFNMLMSAVTQAKNKRITKKQAARTIGAVYASVLAASIAASMVYALRDDDDDEAYLEKFAESLSGKLKDEINPLNMLPIMRDIMSILDGWDVERTDVAVFKDLKDAFDGLFSENKSAWRKVEDFAGAIASSFGIPLKNVLRTGREMYNIFENIFDSDTPTGAGIKDSIVAGITGNEKSNGQQLYEAILSGDQKQIERVSGRFKNQTAIDTAIRKALRDNDPRVKEAAQAIIDEDFSKYTEIANEMVDEGYFSEANIVAAIRSEINALSEDEEETEETEDKEVSIYEMDYFYSAVVGGDTVMAQAIREDIIRTKVANGKEREEAEKSFNSSFQGVVRDEYDAGSISESEAIRMLVSYGGKTEAEAKSKVQYWDFKQGNPDTYVSEYWIDAYNEDVASTGVSLNTFIGYKNAVKDIEGEGAKAKKMAVIDSLPITNAQKDALYFAEGWAESKLWEAPWR